MPEGPAVKLFSAEELSFHAETLLPVRITLLVFWASNQTFNPAIDAGLNELGIGAAVIGDDARLGPIALIAFRYTVYTIPLVRPLKVRGPVCAGSKGVKDSPSVE
jgi:hypothetical protein